MHKLKIRCDSALQHKKVSTILNCKPTRKYLIPWWLLEVEEEDNDEYFDFINKFLDILDGKYEMLQAIGIAKDMINVWLLYKYDGQ
jgi:hypothetical protein